MRCSCRLFVCYHRNDVFFLNCSVKKENEMVKFILLVLVLLGALKVCSMAAVSLTPIFHIGEFSVTLGLMGIIGVLYLGYKAIK